MMNKSKAKATRASKKLLAVFAASALLATGGISSLTAHAGMLEKANMNEEGKYYTDYETHAEALEAAKKLNEQIAEEGNVLLKNDGVLPMSTSNYVSVFGTADDALIGGYGAISDSLTEAGFIVNPALKNFYDKDEYKSSSTSGAGFATGGANIGKETIEFGSKVENTFSLYKDAAVVVFSRNGGEGSDPARVIPEENSDADNVGGWEHQHLAKDSSGKEYKHYLQLTDSENELLDYVKGKFEKVVVILNTSNIMEMYNLQNDPRINSILLMERPGATGVSAVGKILSGEVNPSGRTGDEWYRDFSADPTWMNFGNNNQTGKVTIGNNAQGTLNVLSSTNTNTYSYQSVADGHTTSITGVSYEEGIYVGYRYYETVWAEIKAGSVGVDTNGNLVKTGGQTGEEAADKWWNDNVVYAFGHGLSYTNFEMKMGEIYTAADLKSENLLGASVSPDKLSNSAGQKAEIDKLYVPVTVTNTGNYSGKQVVQLYVNAPYTSGKIEKSYVKLVGFAKTDELKPGAKQTVVVEFDVQDFASFDYEDKNENGSYTFELDAGAYNVMLMDNAHDEIERRTFNVSDNTDHAAILAADDYSLNAVNKTDFSNPDSEYYMIYDPAASYGVGAGNFFGGNKMTILSRADIANTLPDAHNLNDYIIKKAGLDYLDKYCAVKSEDLDDENSKWALTETELAELTKGWDQAESDDVAARENGLCTTLLRDMAGVPFYVDGTDGEQVVNPAWTEFMNQLSFDEIAKIITQCSQSTCAVPSIGKLAARNIDGPNSTADMSWCDETAVANTWNTDLAYKQGVMVGNLYTLKGYTSWYGPAINSHRSPFGGRNNEYYSSDAIHSGYMAAAAASGCESRGVNFYNKHFTVNDQETNRTNIATFVDEQNLRENYFPGFQKALQEGGASALMLTFSRVGIVAGPSDYVLLQEVVREEWGWNGVIGTDFFPYRQSGFEVGTKGADGKFDTTASDYYKFTGGATTCIDLMLRAGGVHPLGNDNTLSAYWNETTHSVCLSSPVDLKTVQALPEYVAPENGGTSVFTSGGKTYKVTSAKAAFGNSYSLSARELGQEESKIDYYYARLQAMRILYCYANSVNVDNGVLFGQNFTPIYDYVDATRQPQPATMKKSLEGKVGVAYTQNLAATEFELGDGNVATYSVSEGKLPAGLTLDAATGVIAGCPTEAGVYEFTLRATVANNYGEVDITLTVADSLGVDGETTVELGGDVDILVYYEGENVIPSNYYSSLTYAAEGLPEGVSINQQGEITGTPVNAGVYEITVTLTGVKGSGANKITDVYKWNITLTVDGGETDVQAQIADILAKISALETKVNDSSAITDINIQLTAIKSDIAALQGASGGTADLTEINAKISALETKVADLESASGGCGSVVDVASMSLVLVPAAIFAGVLALKKRKNNG